MGTSAMNKQEIFDKVVSHLRLQGKKSLIGEGTTGCAYRGHDGTMCAVGCLISDEQYRPTMERANLASLREKCMLPDHLSNLSLDSFQLLAKLQFIHDFYEIGSWEEQWKSCASHYGLEYSKPEVNTK